MNKKSDIRKNRNRVNIKAKAGRGDKIRIAYQKSNRYIGLQAIDRDGKTLTSVNTLNNRYFADMKRRCNTQSTEQLSTIMVGLIKDIGIDIQTAQFFFDRGKFRYHGIVKKSVENLRNNGLRI